MLRLGKAADRNRSPVQLTLHITHLELAMRG
jgi:hypothetical protein